MITIRAEREEDIPAVRSVNERAFGRAVEANVIDALRRNCSDVLSLVAVDGDAVVGHVLFSPVTVKTGRVTLTGMGLAPMAVIPEVQCQGIGSMLARHGLDLLRARHCSFVVVLGHPRYYPRFGFKPAATCGLQCQWPCIPQEVFMAMVFDRDAMKGVKGTARYRDEFNAAV